MVQLGFYHLTRTAPDAALPELLGKTLAAGQRAVVRCGSAARVAAVDKALWAAEWLPHGTARSVAKPGHAAWQPIWVTADEEAPNGARFVFLLDGVRTALDGWDRVFDLFDGADEAAVAAARTRWTEAKAAGLSPAYWKQTGSGWVKA